MKRWASLTQINTKDLLSERRNMRVTAGQLPALPAPEERREHVECHPDILKRDLTSERIATGHVPEKDNHRGDVQRNGGGKKRLLREAEQLIMRNNDVV
jgi:hypothetical protein